MKNDSNSIIAGAVAAAEAAKAASGADVRKPFPITMRTSAQGGPLPQEDAPTEVMARPTRESALAQED